MRKNAVALDALSTLRRARPRASLVALVDREEGGRENIEKEGYWLKAIFTKSEVLA